MNEANPQIREFEKLPKRTEDRYRNSFGQLVAKHKKWNFWSVIGEAHRVWSIGSSDEKSLIDRLESLLQVDFKYSGKDPNFALKCFMVGKNEDHAGPYVTIISRDAKFNKEVRDFILRRMVLRDVGWGDACLRLQADIEEPGHPEAFDLSRGSRYFRNFDVSHRQVVLSETGSSPQYGLTVRVDEESQPPRYATIGGLISIDGHHYGVTVQHLFETRGVQMPRRASPCFDFDESDLALSDSDLDVDEEDLSHWALTTSGELFYNPARIASRKV